MACSSEGELDCPELLLIVTAIAIRATHIAIGRRRPVKGVGDVRLRALALALMGDLLALRDGVRSGESEGLGLLQSTGAIQPSPTHKPEGLSTAFLRASQTGETHPKFVRVQSFIVVAVA